MIALQTPHAAVLLHGQVLAMVGGQGWRQIGELAVAFGLSSLIGLEREWHHKAAGLRTHALVGVGAALFLIVSKYGFSDVLGKDVVLDPSRVAAQIVSGIGFIGGGLIFVRKDIVHGLTTAAIVWITAAIGMACGSGLLLLAVVVTAMHFVVVIGFAPLARTLPSSRVLGGDLRIVYSDKRGVLRDVLAKCTAQGFVIERVATEMLPIGTGGREMAVAATLEVRGRKPITDLATELQEIEGVQGASTALEGRG